MSENKGLGWIWKFIKANVGAIIVLIIGSYMVGVFWQLLAFFVPIFQLVLDLVRVGIILFVVFLFVRGIVLIFGR